MNRKHKRKPERGAIKMCDAIHATREASHLNQQEFAQQIGVAVMTLSKWERGLHEPRGSKVFQRLRDAANAAGLANVQKLFEDHIGPLPFPEGIVDQSVDRRLIAATYGQALVMRLGSIAEWQEVFAHRIANAFLPEVADAVRDALRPALEVVREIIREEFPEGGQFSLSFYNTLALRMEILAARKAFPHKFPKENK
jgi:transcriptional regulator with XRE-family HTH domain